MEYHFELFINSVETWSQYPHCNGTVLFLFQILRYGIKKNIHIPYIYHSLLHWLPALHTLCSLQPACLKQSNFTLITALLPFPWKIFWEQWFKQIHTLQELQLNFNISWSNKSKQFCWSSRILFTMLHTAYLQLIWLALFAAETCLHILLPVSARLSIARKVEIVTLALFASTTITIQPVNTNSGYLNTITKRQSSTC